MITNQKSESPVTPSGVEVIAVKNIGQPVTLVTTHGYGIKEHTHTGVIADTYHHPEYPGTGYIDIRTNRRQTTIIKNKKLKQKNVPPSVVEEHPKGTVIERHYLRNIKTIRKP